jgi:benzodiazapine receptor
MARMDAMMAIGSFIAVIVAWYNLDMTSPEYYATLIKPLFAPPAWIFGPVWTILYVLIAISFGYVFYLCIKKRLPASSTLPFVANLLFNFLYSPIAFGLHDQKLAAVDVVFVWITIVWFITKIYPKVRWVALMNIPYLLWVSFAAVLQLSITYLNW